MRSGLLTALAGAAMLVTGCGVEVAPYDASVTVSPAPVVEPPTGGVALSWSLDSAGYSLSCGEAGIDSVSVNLQDASGALLWSTDVTANCADFSGNANVLGLDGIPAGSYQVLMTASGPGGLFQEAGPSWVTVDSGSASNPGLPTVITLYR